MTTLLSVDWDYFFPNATPYDWGHREADFFLENIWQIRVTDRNIYSGDYAFDNYIPNNRRLKKFWEKVCPNPPGLLMIAESHADVYPYMRYLGKSHVINYDAHHDLGYHDFKEVACDNWTYFGHKDKLISQYDLVIPPWKKKMDEISPEQAKKINIHRKLISCPKANVLFICRSSAWTPPWWDHEWLKFIEYWKKDDLLWSAKIALDYALKARSLNYEKAKKLTANSIL